MRLINALALVAIIGLVIGSIPISAMRAPYSAYSESAQGIATLLPSGLGAVEFRHDSIHELDSSRHGLLVVQPTLVYEDTEVQEFTRFIRAGGKAIIADDGGTANMLLAALDAGIEIPDAKLFSTSYERNPKFPIMTGVANIPGIPEETIMHQPNAVLGEGQPLLLSHPFTWLDYNNNLQPDLGEPRDAWAAAQLFSVGRGKLIVIGDPDMLTPALEESARQTGAAMLTWLDRDRDIVVDEAHRAAADPLTITPVLSGADPIRVTVVAAGIAVGMIIWALQARFTRQVTKQTKPAMTQDPVMAEALAELPT